MIKLDSVSYPYLAVAKHYGVSYSDVLDYVSYIPSATLQRRHEWQRAAWDAYEREQERRQNIA